MRGADVARVARSAAVGRASLRAIRAAGAGCAGTPSTACRPPTSTKTSRSSAAAKEALHTTRIVAVERLVHQRVPPSATRALYGPTLATLLGREKRFHRRSGFARITRLRPLKSQTLS